MAIAKIEAIIRCDGCYSRFDVRLDPAQKMNGVGYSDIADYTEDMIRAGDTFAFSIQGDHQLCAKCTKVVDEKYPEDPPGGLTYDQVCKALNDAAGV